MYGASYWKGLIHTYIWYLVQKYGLVERKDEIRVDNLINLISQWDVLSLIFLYEAKMPYIYILYATWILTYSFFSIVVVDNYSYGKVVVEKFEILIEACSMIV